MGDSNRFQPAWWCRGAHMQTLWPTLFRHGPRVSLNCERLDLPDGDFIDLHWTQNRSGPIVIILHGLEGRLFELDVRAGSTQDTTVSALSRRSHALSGLQWHT